MFSKLYKGGDRAITYVCYLTIWISTRAYRVNLFKNRRERNSSFMASQFQSQGDFLSANNDKDTRKNSYFQMKMSTRSWSEIIKLLIYISIPHHPTTANTCIQIISCETKASLLSGCCYCYHCSLILWTD